MIRVTLPVSRIGCTVYTAGLSRGHPKLRIYPLRKRIKMTGRDLSAGVLKKSKTGLLKKKKGY